MLSKRVVTEHNTMENKLEAGEDVGSLAFPPTAAECGCHNIFGKNQAGHPTTQDAHTLGTSSPTLGNLTYRNASTEGDNMCTRRFIAVCAREQKTGNHQKVSQYRTE